MSKYLEFTIMEQKPKTKVIGVTSKLHGDILGIIKWYNGWRQYCFYPEQYTIFSMGCLEDIQSYIKELRYK
ncbi:unnamed protein product [marine sediment metagenome]|uniref:Uncharacterized protein n=1 Tax=marine sediment metagenome TaxID=412755 RepID=X1DHG0_9ZZZZ